MYLLRDWEERTEEMGGNIDKDKSRDFFFTTGKRQSLSFGNHKEPK